MRLSVRIAQKIQQDSRGRVCGDTFEQGHRFGGFAFVHKQLGQLLNGRLVFRIGLEDGFQNLFGLVVFVLQAVEAREPEGRFGVGRVEAVDFAILLEGLADGFRLAVAGRDLAQLPQIDSSQKPARLHVVGVAFQDFLRLVYGFVNPLRLPVHLRQALADDLRFRVYGVRFFIGLDGFGGVFGAAGGFVLLLVDVAHREVVIGVGARGVFGGRSGIRVEKLLWWRLRHGSGTGDARKN